MSFRMAHYGLFQFFSSCSEGDSGHLSITNMATHICFNRQFSFHLPSDIDSILIVQLVFCFSFLRKCYATNTFSVASSPLILFASAPKSLTKKHLFLQGNHAKFLKNLHAEQVAKLQLKNQHECELLEDIRQFTIKRSAIEKSYSESLLKISSVYLNKKMVCIPEIKLDGTEKW